MQSFVLRFKRHQVASASVKSLRNLLGKSIISFIEHNNYKILSTKMNSNLICLFSLQFCIAAALAGTVNLEVKPSSKQIELVQIHELPKLIECNGAKQSELAPESRIVGVYFDTMSLNHGILGTTLNESKQSQEFDTVQPNKPDSTTELLPVQVPSSSTPTSVPVAVAVVTDAPPSSTSDAPTSTTEAPETNEDAFTPTAPVASKVSRSGSAVFCGEANPNGKSNKRLVLDRIVGGRKTEPGEFPFQVRLNIRSRRGSGICGGVILDESHILTAAHCMTVCVSQYLTTATIENTGVHATIGDHSIRSNDGELEIDIAKIVPHEKYDACNFYANDHDIAIIKTSSPIEYKFTTDGYGSINRPCMPIGSDLAYKDGESVIVSGWGVTRENSGSLSNILRYVQVPIVNVTRCQETYGSRVTNEHICAGYQSGGRDSCQGDSGGPLVRVVDNRYELVGIVSFGYGCGQPGAPGVYTRVASYIDWIKANL